MDALREGRRAHVTRNPRLVRVLADAEIMRDEGEGIVRVFREMADSFLQEPEMASESGLFTITLFNEPDWQVHGPGWRHFVGRLRVTDDQRRMLLLRPHGFTKGDYERLNTVAPEEAALRIRDLVNRGLVVGLPPTTMRGQASPFRRRRRRFAYSSTTGSRSSGTTFATNRRSRIPTTGLFSRWIAIERFVSSVNS